MMIRKIALATAFTLPLLGTAGVAQAEPGYTIEVFVDEFGGAEVYCNGGPCRVWCGGLTDILDEAKFYTVGNTCRIALSDGSQLQPALETLVAFIETAGPNPEAGPPGDTGVTDPPGLVNNENPNNNDVPPLSSNAPPGQGGTPPGQ